MLIDASVADMYSVHNPDLVDGWPPNRSACYIEAML